MDIKGNSYWDVSRINAFLKLFCNVIINRRDDAYIQETCNVLKSFIDRIPVDKITVVSLYSFEITKKLFLKLSCVSDYMTQYKLIINMHSLLSKCADNGVEFYEKFTAKVPVQKIRQEMMNLFLKITSNDLFTTSRKFLNFYNEFYQKDPFIFTYQGYVAQINGEELPKHKIMYIDFNGRSLTVSFFLPLTCLGIIDEDENSLVYLELRDCAIKAESISDTIVEVTLNSGFYRILNDDNEPFVTMRRIDSVLIMLECKPGMKNVFMTFIYPKYNSKTPLEADENNLNQSFCTMASSFALNSSFRLGSVEQNASALIKESSVRSPTSQFAFRYPKGIAAKSAVNQELYSNSDIQMKTNNPTKTTQIKFAPLKASNLPRQQIIAEVHRDQSTNGSIPPEALGRNMVQDSQNIVKYQEVQKKSVQNPSVINKKIAVKRPSIHGASELSIKTTRSTMKESIDLLREEKGENQVPIQVGTICAQDYKLPANEILKSKKRSCAPSFLEKLQSVIVENEIDDLNRSFTKVATDMEQYFRVELKKFEKETEIEKKTLMDIKKAVAKCKESDLKLKENAYEYTEILKRLQKEKIKLMELSDKHTSNMTKLLELASNGESQITEQMAAKQERLDKIIEEIKQEQEECRNKVWHEYLDSISNKVQETLKSHYKI